MSASRPIAAGVAPASTNSPPAAIASRPRSSAGFVAPTWLMPNGRDEHHRAADDPVQDDRGPAHVLELAAPVEQADEEQQAADRERDRHLPRLEAAHQRLVRELRVRLPDELEQRLAREQPERRVDGDPGRREQPDVAAREDPPGSGAGPHRGRARGRRAPAPRGAGRRTCRSGTRAGRRARWRGRRSARAPRTGRRRRRTRAIRPARVAASNRATALPRSSSSRGGRERDEPEDRGHRRRRRGALEQPGEPDHGEADGERR